MDLEGFEEKLKGRKPKKGIHSYIHEIALEAAQWVGEERKLALWIGVTKRIGTGKMKDLLTQMRERKIQSPKYLMGCARNTTGTAGVRTVSGGKWNVLK